ncbi:MAG: metal ABC transporter substrate-binding protein [Firmicutes bacterium]|nr:metal ABC transporter substrate-binding protein [Bacillota bacterium]
MSNSTLIRVAAMLLSTVIFLAMAPIAAQASGETKIQVSVTFDAIKEFVKAVGGDLVDVSAIIPPGADPHNFEPKAQDLIRIGEARLFVYNGLGMEPWVDEAVQAAANESLMLLDASVGADALEDPDPEAVKEHGLYDPHLWLSLKGAKLECGNIRDALIQIDPSNKSAYESNYDAFAAKLDALYDEYRPKFDSTTRKGIVIGHAAYGYLCREFGLEQNSVEDMFAEGEPNAQQMIEIIEYCKAKGVTTVFAETNVSPDVSRALAKEVGAIVYTIYTIESPEDGKDYLERMEYNLSNLYESLID